MVRVACYVDGFNLYHAIEALGKPHLKWVDLHSLAESLTRPHETLETVNYFSAYATWRPSEYARHRKYVSALESVGVDITMAHFKKKPKECRRCRATWIDHEEKETDVRLAIRILEDAFDDQFGRAIVISADSDLVPVVEKIRSRWPKKTILVATPPGRYSNGRDLTSSANSCMEITPGRITKNLLPEKIEDNTGVIIVERPMEYTPPGSNN